MDFAEVPETEDGLMHGAGSAGIGSAFAFWSRMNIIATNEVEGDCNPAALENVSM